MTLESQSGVDDRIVVAYFSESGDAYRAMNELIDEGFSASDIGAAFRTPSTGTQFLDEPAIGSVRGGSQENPAVSGSVGGPASHDQAVTPAGLAPGSGNAFPAPSRPGAIPGGEIPPTLAHDLPRDLPSELPSILEPQASSMRPGLEERRMSAEGSRIVEGESRRAHLRRVFGGPNSVESGTGSQRGNTNMKFGTGEGHLGLSPQAEYSESAFEGSFVGMGLGAAEARSLSGELSRGGAVVSVNASNRASLAEAILERNHGRIRIEKSVGAAAEADQESPVEIYGSMRNYYRRENDPRQRMAS